MERWWREERKNQHLIECWKEAQVNVNNCFVASVNNMSSGVSRYEITPILMTEQQHLKILKKESGRADLELTL